jgi:hypothetical protein
MSEMPPVIQSTNTNLSYVRFVYPKKSGTAGRYDLLVYFGERTKW